jgi:hypothetical protein
MTMADEPKNVRVYNVTIRLPADQVAELDKLAERKSVGGVKCNRQTLLTAWVKRGLEEGRRAR